MKILRVILLLASINSTPSHIVPHTHDDLGWNWTIGEYYNNSVRSIFTTVLSSLEKNPNRKFVYSEVGFLKIFLNDSNKE